MTAIDPSEIFLLEETIVPVLDQYRREGVELPTAVALLKAARAAKAEWALLIRDLENQIGDMMPRGTFDVPGQGVVKRHPRGKRSNWQHDALFKRVCMDGSTGEVLSHPAVERLRAVYGCKGYSASIKQLRAIGLDPDEYCDVTLEPGWTIEAVSA